MRILYQPCLLTLYYEINTIVDVKQGWRLPFPLLQIPKIDIDYRHIRITSNII